MATRIEDYAVIGDLHTLALIGRDGCVDWFCVPRFDSDAVFASLLGSGENGRWRIGPTADDQKVERAYRDGSMVLDTTTTTPDGTVVLTDFMPCDGTRPAIVRILRCTEGSVEISLDLRWRFDNGRTTPWVRRMGKRIVALAGPNGMVLDSDVELRGKGRSTAATWTMRKGDEVRFSMRWQPSHVDLEPPLDAEQQLDATESFWRRWSRKSTYRGEWQEAVGRSLSVLKALTYQPTGGIVAAGTTSLPELIGGERNWDYRFCWLRDSTVTLTSLLAAGYQDEASAWREWLLRAIAGDPSKLQIMYGVAGERDLYERELGWLPGYEDSAPVRTGNEAVFQRQLDVYGEVLDALYVARTVRLDVREGRGAPNMKDASWPLQTRLLDFLEGHWQEPDEGIWEVRGGQQHFVHSKVMAWVALDRAVRTLEIFHRRGPIDRWRQTRDAIKAEVLEKGFDAEANTFVQAYGSKGVDAATLLMPAVGFLPPDDPRVLGTITAVENRLLNHGFVQRYEEGTDGLPGSEGAFLMTTFWLADCYAMAGRTDEARELFQRLLDLRNDVGLLAEEYDPVAKRMLGNFPQAFSHTALVNSAFVLDGGLATGRGTRHPDTAIAAAEERRVDGHHTGDLRGEGGNTDDDLEADVDENDLDD